MKKLLFVGLCLLGMAMLPLQAQENTNQNKFRQLGQEIPTPNVYRNAAGAPGASYWQNRADYDMNISVAMVKKRSLISMSHLMPFRIFGFS